MDEKEELLLTETKANATKIKLEDIVVLRSDLQHGVEFPIESCSDQNMVHIKTEVKEEYLWEDESEEGDHQPESVSILQITKEESVSENNCIDLQFSELARLNTEAGYREDSWTCSSPLEREHSPQGDCKPSSVQTDDRKNGKEESSSIHHNKNSESASPLVQRLHRCDYCEKSFKKRYDLNRHFMVHTGVKPFKCESCSKSFNKKATLMRHIVIHSGTKPYKCATCSKSFNSNSNLKAHMLCHSDTKPYKCDICSKSYNNKSNLTRHVLCHSGARPFKCENCEKVFTRKSTLTRHALCHMDTKPYVCDQCERGFTRKSLLTRHALCHTVRDGIHT